MKALALMKKKRNVLVALDIMKNLYILFKLAGTNGTNGTKAFVTYVRFVQFAIAKSVPGWTNSPWGKSCTKVAIANSSPVQNLLGQIEQNDLL